MIIVDENIDSRITSSLRNSKHKIISIALDYPGISDKDVIHLVKTYEAILLTEDKDFGEWVFAHGSKGFSIILLRYEKSDLNFIENMLPGILRKMDSSKHEFVVITKNKIRRRKI